MKEKLIQFYLDYVNNYLTVHAIADAHLIDYDEASSLIDMGRKYHEEKCEILKIIKQHQKQ